MTESELSGFVKSPTESSNYGYHTRYIEKGELGCFSKIREEFEELQDAYEQGDKIMQLCELSDLVGAIRHYAETLSGGRIDLQELISFNEKTERAFKSGRR